VADKLIENALEDCVSAFDGFGRELCRVHAPQSLDPARATNMSFQSLARARTEVMNLFRVDLGSAVTSAALAATPPTDSTVRTEAVPTGSDGGFMVRIVSTSDNGTAGDATDDPDPINSAVFNVAAIDPSASGVSARRQAAATDTVAAATGDYIQASWSATTNTASDFRVVVEVKPATLGGSTSVWVVLVAPDAIGSTDRATVSAEIGDDYSVALATALPSGDVTTTVTVTAAELRAAIKVAVESVQGTADATDEGPKWKRSAAVDLAARTSGS